MNKKAWIVGLVLLGGTVLSGHAGTYGDLTYEISDGEVTITECDTDASGALSIPSSIEGYPVVLIGEDAFTECNGLTSVTIPDSVVEISPFAFCECDGLTSVTIGNSVTFIGEYAFDECDGLASVTFGGNVTSIGKEAFGQCISLTSVTIPDSVTEIGSSAFTGCTGLMSITIPDSVTEIGTSAFCGCSGLTSVTIGDGVTGIGTYTFYGCSDLTSVTIGDGVTSVGVRAFTGTALSFHTEDNLDYLFSSSAAFLVDGSAAVGDVVIPNEMNGLPVRSVNAFYGCTVLTSVTIPDSVAAIGYGAFYSCSGLTSMTIGNNVISIDNCAFYGCTVLTSLTIPDSVTDIGFYAFYGCTGLTSVTIPDGVTDISYGAFYSCSGLTDVTIGNSVTSIVDCAFCQCFSLTNASFTGDAPSDFGDSVFAYAASDFVINYYEGASGFTSPSWNGYPCEMLSVSTDEEGADGMPDGWELYDDFSSGTLDSDLWSLDVENSSADPQVENGRVNCSAALTYGNCKIGLQDSSVWGVKADLTLGESIGDCGIEIEIGLSDGGVGWLDLASDFGTLNITADFEDGSVIIDDYWGEPSRNQAYTLAVVLEDDVIKCFVDGELFVKSMGTNGLTITSCSIGTWADGDEAEGDQIDWAEIEGYIDNVYVLRDSIGDEDVDGMPDDWEQQIVDASGGSITNTAQVNPEDDFDGDGCSNLEEYIAGTAPASGGSVFAVEDNGLSESGYELNWTAVSGRVYGVWWSTNLASGFRPLVTNLYFPQNSYTDTLHTADDSIMYQLKVELEE